MVNSAEAEIEMTGGGPMSGMSGNEEASAGGIERPVPPYAKPTLTRLGLLRTLTQGYF